MYLLVAYFSLICDVEKYNLNGHLLQNYLGKEMPFHQILLGNVKPLLYLVWWSMEMR